MKMKELERRTGVSREAIRFYIREGLVPEPERPKKNVARYQDAHVDAINLIKHLQDDQQLPLDVIKPMVRAKAQLYEINRGSVRAIDAVLAHGLGDDKDAAPLTLSEAANYVGLSETALTDLASIGMLILDEDDQGIRTLGPQSIAIAKQWALLQQRGLADGESFSVQTAQLYVQLIDWLADHELSLFFNHVAGRMGAAQAADVAARSIAPVNDMIGLMRTQALLTRLRDLRPAPPRKEKKKKP